jgi:hypothetical protein
MRGRSLGVAEVGEHRLDPAGGLGPGPLWWSDRSWASRTARHPACPLRREGATGSEPLADPYGERPELVDGADQNSAGAGDAARAIRRRTDHDTLALDIIVREVASRKLDRVGWGGRR